MLTLQIPIYLNFKFNLCFKLLKLINIIKINYSLKNFDIVICINYVFLYIFYYNFIFSIFNIFFITLNMILNYIMIIFKFTDIIPEKIIFKNIKIMEEGS